MVAPTEEFWRDSQAGDSVAVNGCCLTLLRAPKGRLAAFFLMTETRGLTNLASAPIHHIEEEPLSSTETIVDTGKWTPVNLELSLRLGGPIGGHFLSGHVDGLAVIREVLQEEDGSRRVWLELGPKNPMQPQWRETIERGGLVPKGSVALDGVSLTVQHVKETGNKRGEDDYGNFSHTIRFRVDIIPHTWRETQMQYCWMREGCLVNVELDRTAELLEEQQQKKTAVVVATAGAVNGTQTPSIMPKEHLPPMVENGRQVTTAGDDDDVEIDARFMRMAIEVGERGRSSAAPNPWVGCVVVSADPQSTVIGEGVHMRAGTPHAGLASFHSLYFDRWRNV